MKTASLPQPTAQKLLTEQDVQAIFGLSLSTLRNWRCAGKGPRFAKLGSAVRYTPENIQAFIDAGTVATTK